MKALLFLLFFVFLQACEDDIVMVSRVCNLPCYTGPTGTAVQGICEAGVTLCDENDMVIECEGQVTPEDELCDMLDNDCDGIVDNNLVEEWAGQACGSDIGACKAGREICYEGQKICDGREEGTPEQCNGVDDDCDGLVDNIDGLELCYTASPETLAHGECRAGIMECVSGELTCMYERVPTTEICDGLDNDCDGMIDEDLASEFDVFFIIDGSGSMGVLTGESVTTAYRIAGALEGTDSLFGAARVPGGVIPETYTYSNMLLISDLVDAATFQGVITNVSSVGGGSEPTIDAVYNVCLGAEVSWRENSTKAIVVFSDEAPQSVEGNTIQDAVTACIDAGVIIYAAAIVGVVGDYQNLVHPTGGEIILLGPAVWMVDDILALLAVDCN